MSEGPTSDGQLPTPGVGSPESSGSSNGARPAGTLGTFLGVYLPTTLTILGVMMYLRIGAVVGHAGIENALYIVLLANAITLITAVSFSAVATNIRVGVGGAYYIISRSVGLEVGGAIGLPLFLSQVFSVTLYAFGLAEAIQELLWADLPVQEAAAAIIVLVAALAYAGPGVAMKTQVPLLIAIIVSLVALGTGWAGGAYVTEVGGEPILDPDLGFWGVFAVFFPAVTGVMAGLGLSGDLKNPSKAIPIGAITATLTGIAIYIIVPLILVASASPEALKTSKLIWTEIAPLGAWLIFPGLMGAIFSSAVGSILGAPRTLQALAMDRLAPRKFAEAKNEARGPVMGLFLTTALALGAVLLGDLNAVALVVAMFFLTVYGTVNIVAALEGLAGDPSWRPKLKVPWPISLVGGLACVAVMFLIHPVAAVIAIFVEVALWVILARRERHSEWGDARRGAYEALIRWSLLRLRMHAVHARNWRPHILVFARDTRRRLPLIRFGSWFSQQRGVVTVCELVIGDLLDSGIDPAHRQTEMDRILDDERIVAFAEVNVVRNLTSGIVNVAQANGIAGMHSNTVLIGWPENMKRMSEFLSAMRRLERVNKSVIICRISGHGFPPPTRGYEVHVWWGGMQRNGDLMLLLAHLLTSNTVWRRASVRIMTVVRDEAERASVAKSIDALMSDARIRAASKIIVAPEERPISDIIRTESARAAIVFLGLQTPEPGDEDAYAARLDALARNLDTVFFVKNSSLFVGELV